MKKIVPYLIGLYFNFLALFIPKWIGKKGFLLFSSPRRSMIKPNHTTFFNTAHKFTFQHNGDAIQCYRWGSGKKNLLFIHGWQSHTFRWKTYIDALSKDDFTIYSLDAPGHGLSGGKNCNIPIYSSVIEKCLTQLPPVDTIISHSLGSISTLYTIYRLPSLRIHRLIISGTPGEGKDYVTSYKKALGLSDRASNAIIAAFVDFTGHLPEFFSAIKFAEAVKIPMLSIHDNQDLETPYHYAVEIQKAAKHSHLITTSGLGHNLRSLEVVKYVVDFVNNKFPFENIVTSKNLNS